MCGIWTLINKDNSCKKEFLHYFWNIQHRGPDNSHLETFDNVYVGFHRLAIMDTSFKSNQPYIIKQEDRTIVFICNGEIYNYKELDRKYNLNIGTSDCMVIPKLYSMLNNINLTVNLIKGEYAFILYEFDDMKKLQKYFVCRDTIGVRPLYMIKDNINMDMYSSEMKGIPSTYQIEEFPPGFIKEVDTSSFNPVCKMHKTRLYDEVYNFKTLFSSMDEDMLENIRKVVYTSIKKRLTADRPIAFLLSGGVDSSLVASISARILNQPIRTFCCGMEGSTDMIMARKVAEHIGSNHTEIIFTPEEGLKALEDVIKTTETWDTTTIRASVGQYLISKYIGTKTDCRVVMVGEGPDEVCSSYLFNYYAPNAEDMDKTARDYVKEIHMFDGRRADRCTARWGLECRVPFLDPEFIKTYWSIKPELRMPNKDRIEKYLLRKAFSDLNLLPEEVLWRKKEAFSDGVSSKENSWFNIIQKYCENNIKDMKVDTTPEATYFKNIYNKYYGNNNDSIIPHYWQPKWDKDGNVITKYVDPSARTLDVYNLD